MSNVNCKKRGFSLLELLVALAILALSIGSVVIFLRNQLLGNLEGDAQIIAARLGEAQTRAITTIGGYSWGVHFDNSSTAPFYAIFPGTVYSAPSSTYYLSTYIEFQTPAAATATDIVFNKLNGTIATTTSIVINLKTATSSKKTITVTSQGQISVQ